MWQSVNRFKHHTHQIVITDWCSYSYHPDQSCEIIAQVQEQKCKERVSGYSTRRISDHFYHQNHHRNHHDHHHDHHHHHEHHHHHQPASPPVIGQAGVHKFAQTDLHGFQQNGEHCHSNEDMNGDGKKVKRHSTIFKLIFSI